METLRFAAVLLLVVQLATIRADEATSDVCQQPVKQGMCMAYFLRYYFSPQSGQCRQFIYGGCGGNGNNFQTKEVCEATCLKDRATRDVCQQPKVVGPCKAAIRRFFFNSARGVCEEFIYGGCRGNGNNFDTKKQCEAACA
uniref:Ccr_19 putative toxin n=1 Tax=Crassispira cerithina TaxID=1077925 RepID=A0A098LWE0_CRACE